MNQNRKNTWALTSLSLIRFFRVIRLLPFPRLKKCDDYGISFLLLDKITGALFFLLLFYHEKLR